MATVTDLPSQRAWAKIAEIHTCCRRTFLTSPFEGRADCNLAGSALRNEAASYLQTIHGDARVELEVCGKKVDIVCKVSRHGKATDLYVEVKDYGRALGRTDLALIHADYSGLLGKGQSASLLVVTRRGLSTSGETFIDSQPSMFHQTIWEIEDEVLGLLPYVQDQTRQFEVDGLNRYYIPARARQAHYDDEHKRALRGDDVSLFEAVQDWLVENRPPPLAILGGYGAGKSSFAKRLMADQANKALSDPTARRPVLIKLGNITRSSSLDSLLGSLFTSEYVVRGYSFPRFKELNAKGRLLIILDGFDEMKHAMTWTEFRNEIQELNALNDGESRVLLLGRPTAFTSDDEHLEVLRGRRRIAGGTRRLHDWPEFREYDLEPFTRAERIKFVEQLLLSIELDRCGEALSDAQILSVKGRAQEVNALADLEDEVFGKPVHAKILVDLAVDPDFDPSAFKGNVTRWSLYSEFFAMLARRETSKAARSPIEGDHRLEFLRRVALWLWEERDGMTSFRASDIPTQTFMDLPDGDADNPEDKRREYLAGAFLERKAADTFFFPHRSFAEFLIAEHLVRHRPASGQHEHYDKLIQGGVETFLQDAPPQARVGEWGMSLSANSGILSIEYLMFLGAAAGGLDILAEAMPKDSPWQPLVGVFALPVNAVNARREIIASTIVSAPQETVALLLCGISRYWALLSELDMEPKEDVLCDYSQVVAAALITRVMRLVREDKPMPRHTVSETSAEFLYMGRAAMNLDVSEDSRAIVFSWVQLGEEAARIADSTHLSVVGGPTIAGVSNLGDERIAYFTVRNIMPPKDSQFFHQMVLKRGWLSNMSIVSKR